MSDHKSTTAPSKLNPDAEKRCLELKQRKPVSTKRCDFPQRLPYNEEVVIEKILHLNSINDFYILVEKDRRGFEYVESMLGSVLAFDQEPYQHCAADSRTQVAAYNDEGKWKRVKVVDFLPDDTVFVHYIDHGTIGHVTLRELRKLPAVFEAHPPFAIHCSMDVVQKSSKDCSADPLGKTLMQMSSERASETPYLDSKIKAICIRRETRPHDVCNIVLVKRILGDDWGTVLVVGGWCERKSYEGPREGHEDPTDEQKTQDAPDSKKQTETTSKCENKQYLDKNVKTKTKIAKDDHQKFRVPVHGANAREKPQKQANLKNTQKQRQNVSGSNTRHNLGPIQHGTKHPEHVNRNFPRANIGKAGHKQEFERDKLHDRWMPCDKKVPVKDSYGLWKEFLATPLPINVQILHPEHKNTKRGMPQKDENFKPGYKDKMGDRNKHSLGGIPEGCYQEASKEGNSNNSRGSPESKRAPVPFLSSAAPDKKNTAWCSNQSEDYGNLYSDQQHMLEDFKPDDWLPTTAELQDYPFNKTKIVPAPEFREKMAGMERDCKILHVVGCNEFIIAFSARAERQPLELNDLMFRHWRKKECGLKQEPRVDDVVIGKEPNRRPRSLYFRALILKREPFDNYLVQDIDCGRKLTVSRDLLFSMTEDVMKYPVLGYKVILQGVKNDPPMILKSDVEAAIHSFNAEIKVKISDEGFDANKVPIVTMKTGGTNEALCDIINEFREWSWKILLERACTDDQIYQKTGYEVEYSGLPSCPSFGLPLRTEFPVVIRAAYAGCPRSAPVILFEPLLEEHQAIKNVLRNQIKEYTDHVTASKYLPSPGRLFLACPADKSHPSAGEWLRAVQLLPRVFTCIDVGPKHNSFGEPFKIRRMPVDFGKIHRFVIEGVFKHLKSLFRKDGTTGIMLQAFKEVFVEGREMKLLVESFSDERRCVCYIECVEFRKRVGELRQAHEWNPDRVRRENLND